VPPDFNFHALSSDAFNALTDAITIVSDSGSVLYANNAATTANAVDPNHPSILGLPVHGLFHDYTIDPLDCPVCQAIVQQESTSAVHIQRGKRWFAITISVIGDDHVENRSKTMLQVCHDISKRKEAQFQFQTANRLYGVLRLTNKAITSAKSTPELLDAVCNIAVKYGRFAMAWIGMIEGNEVLPVNSAGDTHNYLEGIKVRVDGSQWGKGPVGLAIAKKGVVVANNISTDERFAPWRDAALACGFKSIAAIPVKQQQECVGIFVIYSHDYEAFDRATLELLSVLSDDISSVVSYIYAEEQRVKAQEKLRQLSRAIEQSKSAIVITDIDGTIEYINPYYCVLTGYEAQEAMGHNIHHFPRVDSATKLLAQCLEQVLSGKEWRGEVAALKKNGDQFWILQSVSPIFSASGDMTHIVWTAEDNSELHDAHETISRLAYFDPLTGLPNRRLYHDRFDQAISGARRHRTKLALLYFDLDNFKTINDSLGHDFGDLLLQHVAKTLTNAVREMDTVARLGGDEFSVILNDIEENSDVMHVADKILHDLNRKAVLGGREMTITTSIGISLYPDDGDTVSELMKRSDMAMYHAKEKGKNNFQFFAEFLNANAQQRLRMEHKIEQALVDDEFELYYQPQFNIASGKLSGVEALIRWPDKDGGMITPGEFIPIAEETRLIIDIGNWVVQRACSEFKQLLDDGFPAVKVAVNISANQFHRAEVLFDTIEASLQSSGLPRQLLQLELTESVLIGDAEETIATIDRLKAQQISFAIDDFGTGYSSLSYLKSFPADIIKIDRSFVLDIESDLNDQAIIRAIVVMAHELDLKVLAEGVENQQQLDFLKAHHCDFVQGFFYAKPMPAHELLANYGG
jgi:diguanylate cyclase (GGDEF)-like protein/PAS domain S-box-containing protein